MTHPLAHGVVTSGRRDGDVRAALTALEDPAEPVAAGAELHLRLTVSAGSGAAWGYGYLMVDDLAGSATVTAVEDAEWFPEQRWFRVRADAGTTAVGRFTLAVVQSAKPTVRPSIAVAAAAKQRLVRTPALSDRVFRVGRRPVTGLRLVVPVGRAGSVALPAAPAGPSGAPQVSSPRFGVARLADDGASVRYEPRPGFTGYDRFTVAARGRGDGGTTVVTVYVGDAEDVPGVLTPPEAGGRGTSAFRPWQENEVVGALPWPSAHRPARGERS